MAKSAGNSGDFTPALGMQWLTPFYDFSIAIFTRERIWRDRLIALLDPQPGDRVVDIGCGTGSLAVRLATQVDVIGIDPDGSVLARAKAKADDAEVSLRFIEGFFGGDILPAGWAPTKIVSSLVLHQTPPAEKRRIIQEIFDTLSPGGVFCLADYGRQPTAIQRLLFRNTVQRVDGIEDTQPNVDGILETILADVGFENAAPVDCVRTFSGAISIWQAKRPA